jgi:hypothetical protein
MSKKLNLLDHTYGFLTVVAESKSINGKARWLVKCRCGKEFITTTDTLRSGNTTSCGCGRTVKLLENSLQEFVNKKFNRLTVSSYAHTKNYKIYFNCNCECGNVTVTDIYSLKRGDTKSCGCLCKEINSERLIELSKSQKRENHPKWKGGKTDERHLDMQSDRYRQWRISVFQRDNYRCKICFEGGNIRAHHIEAYKTHPELRYDMGNGATLCDLCHKKFHKTYGKIGFDTFDYVEFYYSGYFTNGD